MSNFAVTYLFSKKTRSGLQINIEDNIGEPVHLHLNRIRLDIDYKDFGNIVEKAYLLISETINFDINQLKMIDPVMLYALADFNLLKKVTRVGEDRIAPNKLIIRRNLIDKETNTSLEKYVKNKAYDRNQVYKNYYPCNTTRRVLDYRNDPPTNSEAKIYVLGDSNILLPPYDLAACNYEKDIVDIVRVYFSSTFLIKKKGRFSLIVNKTMSRITNHFYRKQKKSKKNNTFYDLEKAKKLLNENDINYLIIPAPISPVNEDMLIVNDEQLSKFKENNNDYSTKDLTIFDNYVYCYGLRNPTGLYKNKELLLINYHIPFQFSLGEAAILPFSKKVVKYIWESAKKHEVSRDAYFVLLISNCLLNKRKIEQPDIDYMENNKGILNDAIFLSLMNEVFYEQHKVIITYISNGWYSRLFEDYRKSLYYY